MRGFYYSLSDFIYKPLKKHFEGCIIDADKNYRRLCIFQKEDSGKGRLTAAYEPICIVGLVISIISIFVGFWGATGIIGVIVSAAGMANANEHKERGKELAGLGILIGACTALYAFYAMLYQG